MVNRENCCQPRHGRLRRLLLLCLASQIVASSAAAAPPAATYAATASSSAESASKPAQGHKIDRSGKTRKGKASYYSRKFSGKPMANGEPMDPASNEAASKVLPIGTTAKVTNLDNNKSEVVVVKDRGPYVDGRIIDVTPKTADKLDMKKDGVTPVAVKPLQLPKPEQDSGADAPKPSK